VLAAVARGGQRRPVVSPTERSTSIPFSFPRFPIKKLQKRQAWISPEIGGLVLTSCSDQRQLQRIPGLFYL
jgi:hypothetical protein